MLVERCWWFGRPFSYRTHRTWWITTDLTGQDAVYTDKYQSPFGLIVGRNFLRRKTKKRFRPADWIHRLIEWLRSSMCHRISLMDRQSWSVFFHWKECETFLEVFPFGLSSILDNELTTAWLNRLLLSTIFDRWCDVDNISLLQVSRHSEWKTRRLDHPKTVSYTHLTLPTNREV